MVAINTNSNVSVVLTDKGKAVLKDYTTNLKPELALRLRDQYRDNNDGKITMQLHKLMLIFGSYCWVGNENLFKDNIVYLDDQDIKDETPTEESTDKLDWKQEGKKLKATLPNGSYYVVDYCDYFNKPYLCGLYAKNESRIDSHSYDMKKDAIEWCELHYKSRLTKKEL